MQPFPRTLLRGILFLATFAAGRNAAAQSPQAEEISRGSSYFQQNCALCHTTTLGPGNTWIMKQGPSLVGVVGRPAGSLASFGYTKALAHCGLTWDTATLDRFLTFPARAVPGTTMPMPVPDPANRAAVIAYLATLKIPPGVTPVAAPAAASTLPPGSDPGDWRLAAPGAVHHITPADLPPPFKTRSAGNPPHIIDPPAGARLAVPPGFTVRLFASNLAGPRVVRVAPNGDIFVAETGADQIRVLRAADGANAPTVNQVYVDGLDRPFGIAFYPPGDNPRWIYIANNNSVVRFPYHDGDLKPAAGPQVIVPRLSESTGMHTTRDIAFSRDGKRMFISVGSGSNVGDDMERKSPDDIRAWEAAHGLGAAWGPETNRANILVTDPEGRIPLHTFATGIRNPSGIAVNPATGDVWASTNERDGLGDDLVPDYVTRVKEGGYYGWPWYYMGNFVDPRRTGERPDLAGKATVPDVLLQSHSAPLAMTFYTAASGAALFPAEYRGDAFVASHGSWNRTTRTGYKVIRVRLDRGIPTGEYDDFLTGFVVDDSSVWGRPVGVAVAHDGALLVTDDGGGTLWRVSYKRQ
jgi:glucose/arabinose dehydrogenase